LEDLERGHQTPNRKNEAAQAQKPSKSISGESPNNIFKLDQVPRPVIVLNPTRRQMIENIWDKVEPFQFQLLMNSITEDTAQDSITQPQDSKDAANSLEQCLSQYPTWKRAMENSPNWHTVFICSLKHRMTISETNQNPEIMAYCWHFLREMRPEEKLGSLLNGCYKRGLFPQLKNLDSSDELNSMLKQILLLVECLILLNEIYKLYDFHESTTFHGSFLFYIKIRNIITCRNSIEEILGLRIWKLFQIIHLTYWEESGLGSASGDTLRIDDLNIRSLTSIGKLSIKWTDILEDHLKLSLLHMTISIKNDYLFQEVLSPMSHSQRLYVWASYMKKKEEEIQLIFGLVESSLLEDLPQTFDRAIDYNQRSGLHNFLMPWELTKKLLGRGHSYSPTMGMTRKN
jgi:hypothetical protein